MENLIISFLGAALVLDTTVAFQFLISQPIIACTLLGWFMGDIYLGMQTGIFLQLLWLGIMPVGASIVPEGNFASIVVTALVIRYSNNSINFYTVLIVSIIIGVFISYIGGQLVKVYRKLNSYLFKKVISDINRERFLSLGYINIVSLSLHFIVMFLAILIALNSLDFIYSGVETIPLEWDIYFKHTAYVVLGIGAGLIIPLFSDRYSKIIFVTGVIIGIMLFFG